MTDLQKQFVVSYYQWAKDQFRREFDEGFPILSKLRCSTSLTVREFISTLPDDQQWRFALALLRRGRHYEAAELCGEPLSHEERELLHSYHQRIKTAHFAGTFGRSGPSTKEKEIREAIQNGTLEIQTPTAAFRKAILERLSQGLGAPRKVEQRGANGIILLATEIGAWTVWTHVGFSSKVPLRYSQVLSTDFLPGFNPEVSFLACLGIVGDTMWDLLTTEAANEAIDQLVALCAKFLSDAPQWLP